MKRRKCLSVLAAAVLSVGMLAGCGGNGAAENSAADGGTADSAATAEGSQAVTENAAGEEAGGTVKMLVGVTGGKDDEEMRLFVDEMEKATGLQIEIEKPASDYDQVMMQKLSGGEVYDLIYVSAGQYMNLAEQEALTDITDDVHASDILTNNIDQQEWDDITIDGKIYAGFNKKEVHRVVALNNTLLKKAGIDYKTIEPTMDGYYEVFQKMRQVSDTEDFYPFDVVLSEAWDLQPWMAAAGLKTGVLLNEDGKKYVPISTDEAAPVWEWFKKLYDDGLMDPSSFVDKTSDMREKMGASTQKTGCSVDWAAWVGLHNANAESAGLTAEDYEVVSLPGLQTPDGKYMLGKGGASLFAVPANAQNVEGAIRVLEYFATQEGGELLSVGIEGYDYVVEDGVYTHTEIGAAHGNDHGAPVPIYKDFVAPMGYNTGMEEALGYGEYASIEMTIPNEADYKEIVGKWAIKMVKGETSIEDGLAGMRQELLERGVTEV
ncbi:MAG: extracellular solute-binding protein [Eubacteriales bacterium]|nr:extracellular solute-binding protein [Eubacteriales bacterium]